MRKQRGVFRARFDPRRREQRRLESLSRRNLPRDEYFTRQSLTLDDDAVLSVRQREAEDGDDRRRSAAIRLHLAGRRALARVST